MRSAARPAARVYRSRNVLWENRHAHPAPFADRDRLRRRAVCRAGRGPHRPSRRRSPKQRRQATGLETAVLAGGCFWGIQAVYQHVKGVTNAVSGYAGGDKKDAVYETVSTGTTGHAESVAVTFDPRVISYGKILQIYFAVAHDPTQLNRQGPDSGPQYRSEIFPQTDGQRTIAQGYIAQLDAAQAFAAKIVTKVGRQQSRLLPGRELSPGLRHHPSLPALHRLQRRAEGGEAQSAVSGSCGATSR